jgi:phage shock protein E
LRLLLLILLLLVSCTRPSSNGKSLPDYDPKLAQSLVKNENAILLDVRTEVEFKMSHINGAHRIGIGDLEGSIDKVKELVGGDLNRPIVVYCLSGGRAGKAKDILLKNGFKKVTNLGSYKDWPEDRK